jgi:hypothetical protein
VRRWVWLALLVVACSAPYSTGASTSTPSPWSCRLPVVLGAGGPQTAGFLSLPGSTITPAPNAVDGLFYDRPLARWVPGGPPRLSDDGLLYAYVDGDQTSSRIHLVNLRTNADKVLAAGGPWRIVGIRPDAVYVDRIEYLPYSQAYGVLVADRGLWKVALDGGAPAQLTSDSRGWMVAGGAAWGGGVLDVAGGPNDIVRLDLKTMNVATWFAPGMRSRVIAVDANGVPLILSEAADEELWRVPAPNGAVKVWSGPGDGPRPEGSVAVDGRVVWMNGSALARNWIIYRYSAASGLEVVANFTDRLVSVAGPCA